MPDRNCDGPLMAYFGYGSLVNQDTLQTSWVASVPAQLKGWQRHWQGRPETPDEAVQTGEEKRRWQAALARHAGSLEPGRRLSASDIALLSVHRSPGTLMNGMLVIDRLCELPGLDDRERLYDRVVIDRTDLELFGHCDHLDEIAPENLFIYVGQERPDDDSLLLQSYLDVVMSGFLRVHGEAGLPAFLQSTVGFQRRIVPDRHTPIYPRFVNLDPQLALEFDAMLAEAGVIFSGNGGADSL